MPDFERVFDKFSVDFARTPEEKAYAVGFIKGKRRERIEMLLIISVITFIFIYALYI